MIQFPRDDRLATVKVVTSFNCRDSFLLFSSFVRPLGFFFLSLSLFCNRCPITSRLLPSSEARWLRNVFRAAEKRKKARLYLRKSSDDEATFVISDKDCLKATTRRQRDDVMNQRVRRSIDVFFSRQTRVDRVLIGLRSLDWLDEIDRGLALGRRW